ncbi:hypothetical protein PPL_09951 [Heterostelium album PN500]|uniref:Uncharacterized protein n=1 Tax=Heterostelium pallidum (strain ATCC 26659 / Pp 5 / PN500) TaxID=670386 RepID=D3BPM6_HETP5|nr:hypothetical protein PPL_09951 [Heterostelium album PN500]EFA76646.1 hypothetical protein PPL_09951 [Heterostelium album PN500]|eukprot:XP_020428778.1 hypothetical protein PPL_09951 [Heterostelium album PN500]
MNKLIISFIVLVALFNTFTIAKELAAGQWTLHGSNKCSTPQTMNLVKKNGMISTISPEGFLYLTNVTVNNDGTFQGYGALYRNLHIYAYTNVKGTIYNPFAFIAVYSSSSGFTGDTYYYSLSTCNDSSDDESNIVDEYSATVFI